MTDTVTQSYAKVCKANGCPLPATVVTDYWPQEKKRDPRKPKWGVCDFHKVATGDEWTATTDFILENKRSLQLWYAMQNIKDENMKPLTGERVDEWIQRAGSYLRQQILPSTNASKDPSKTDNFNNLMRMVSGR